MSDYQPIVTRDAGYHAKVWLDSVAPCGKRLTTIEVRYPRFVHSELLTHRMFSRNSASSRAIPTSKLLNQILTDPAMPVWIGAHQSGMQAACELPEDRKAEFLRDWLKLRQGPVEFAQKWDGVAHKQLVNRPLETWMWITVLISATSFGNFLTLRCHKDAQPEIKKIAEMMRTVYFQSKPQFLAAGEWHTPLIFSWDGDLPLDSRKKVSAGRCARLSYLTHDGKRDYEADLNLFERLALSIPPHMSPLEHQAEAQAEPIVLGNFMGWKQFRKEFPSENQEEYTWDQESASVYEVEPLDLVA